jgi:putative ABC transport system permease protein
MVELTPAMDSVLGRSKRDGFGLHASIALRLAWRNIARDRVRLGIAVAGVGFAVLLMTIQLGLLVGFATTSSSLVDRAGADFWIVPRGAKDVDQAGFLSERQQYVALGIPGAQSVESLVVRFADWKRPDGGVQSVIVVGVDPVHPALRPWSFVAGSTDSLREPDGVIVDALYAGKLGITRLGQSVEIMGHRARVVGITSGIRTFTQSPYVFTSLANAKLFTGLTGSETTYLLVNAGQAADLPKLKTALQAALPSSDVWSAHAFSWQTRFYWLITTGAGAAVLIAAILGVVVGLVIVSQTLYSATVERLDEYATIRAIGAGDRFLRSIIVRQALLSAAFGYSAGTIAALLVAWLAQNSSAAISISVWLLLLLAAVTVAMGLGASLISIRKVLRTDAASAFR